jgi:hypothetical protein
MPLNVDKCPNNYIIAFKQITLSDILNSVAFDKGGEKWKK